MFHLPLSDPRIQSLNEFDLAFYELSEVADDPKRLEQLKNTFVDTDFDHWLDDDDALVTDEYGVTPVDIPDDFIQI